MSKTYLQPGNVMTRSNPGGSKADVLLKIGRIYGVTLNGSATEPTGTLQTIGVEGVFALPKLANHAFTQGDPVYSNGDALGPTSGVGTGTTGGFPVGIAFETVAAAATTVPVLLNVATPTGASPTGVF